MKKIIAVLIFLAMLFSISVPVYAAGGEEEPAVGVTTMWGDTLFKFYGSARTHFWRMDESKEIIASEYSDEDTYLSLDYGARLGLYAYRGPVIARIEYGAKKNSEVGEAVDVRVFYGGFKWDNSDMWIGKSYTPTSFYYSGQVFGVIKVPGLSNVIMVTDYDMCGFGGFFSREALIQYRYWKPGHEIRLAVIEPNNTTSGIKNSIFTETDVDIPKLEFRYTFSGKNHEMKLGGGYQTFKAVTAENKKYTVDSWVLALGGYYKFDKLNVQAMVSGGQNINTYGQFWFPTSKATYDAASDDIKNNTGIGYTLSVNYKVNKMYTVEAGYGFAQSEDDIDGAEKDKACTYYLQVPITVARGAIITPEAGVIDHMKSSTGAEQGDAFYYGMKMQFDF